MFQSFTATTTPDTGGPRLAALRVAMTDAGVDGVLVPRADAHQGEYVAPRDERLAWLTGFTGSAGFAAVLADRAGVFIDGRYRLQVRTQCDMDHFTPVHWPETRLEDWLKDQMPGGGCVGFDPWLHTSSEIDRLETALAGRQISLRPIDNLIDAIWDDQPGRPTAMAEAYPLELAGLSAQEKRADVAADLRAAGHAQAVLSLPDSIAWLLNIRGGDLPHLPVVQAFAVIDDQGDVTLVSDPAKFDGVALGDGVAVRPWDDFETVLAGLPGPVRVDPATAPYQIRRILQGAGVAVAEGTDPCSLPKARKQPAEIAATRAAHLRDGAAMVRFLHWFDQTAPTGTLTEIDCVTALERFRAEGGALKDISFDTIAGAGPNGAIVHYRVTEDTNAPLQPGQLFLIDSGGQYRDGTTDITRTLPVGAVGQTERDAFTQVLRGMIAVHRARFPKGITGRDLDALARAPLWAAGRDFDHGTGHGVGVYLSVHEGPQRISRASTVALEPGMILSNEPGYYRAGDFGIRIENLIVVTDAPPLPGGDDRPMLQFETLSFVPIDRRLIVTDALSAEERHWLNGYHAEVLARIGPALEPEVADWLATACAPL
jgi:Xaa-Pro aminopeptidase